MSPTLGHYQKIHGGEYDAVHGMSALTIHASVTSTSVRDFRELLASARNVCDPFDLCALHSVRSSAEQMARTLSCAPSISRSVRSQRHGISRRLADARALEVTVARRVCRRREVKCAAGGGGDGGRNGGERVGCPFVLYIKFMGCDFKSLKK